jgi:hypothetical protein
LNYCEGAPNIPYVTEAGIILINDVFIKDVPDIRPDNPAFFISGIRLDIGFDLLNIRPDTGYQKVGYPAN